MELTAPVALAEYGHSFFLATTLQNTSVPIVSATVPLTPASGAEGDGSNASSDEAAEGDDAEDDLEATPTKLPSAVLESSSIVIGSFTHEGLTYAVIGQDALSLVSVEPDRLSESACESHMLVLPRKIALDGADPYALTSIASGAFASCTDADEGEDDIVNGNDAAASDGEGSEGSDGAAEAAIIEDADAAVIITTVVVPSSVTDIAEGAFEGATSIRCLVVEPGDESYSSYDGCLYTADTTCLLLVPEGRLGAVRLAPSTEEVGPAALSHCAGEVVLSVEAGSAALTSENGFLYEKDLSTLEFPVPIAVTDDDSVIASTPSLEELEGTIELNAPIYDEASALEALASEPEIVDVDLRYETTAEDRALSTASIVDGAYYAEDGSAASPELLTNDIESTEGQMSDDGTATDVIMAESLSSNADAAAINGGALPCTWKDSAGKTQTITAEQVAQGKGDASRAGWSFDPGSGKLSIWSAIGTTVGHLWVASGEEYIATENIQDQLRSLYWGPLRSRIIAVDTTQLSGAVDMGCWFIYCSFLKDISALRIPDGSRNGSIPWSLYNTLTEMAATELPSTFYVPEGVQSMHATFGASRLESVYEGFAFPSTLTLGGFEGCGYLKYVPGSLFSRLTKNSSLDARYMFASCGSLTTLGDGFSIPSQITSVNMMFVGCDSLAYIPSSLDLTALGNKTVSSMFGARVEDFKSGPYSPLKKTYFAGTSAQLSKLLPSDKTNHLGIAASQINTPEKYWELIYGRELVLTGNTVKLHTRPKGDSEWPAAPWQSIFALNNSINDPGLPRGNSYGFSGWYDNPELTGNPVSFPLAVNRPIDLYSEYVSRAGALPCTWTNSAGKTQTITAANVAAGKGDASRAGWSFDPGTGTLSVWSAIGTTVSNLWAAYDYEWEAKSDTLNVLYWGPLRSRVTAVDTMQLSGATDMGCWFTQCFSLADISLLRIPEGSRGGSIPASLYNTLSGAAITELPSTFYVPEGVKSLHSTFASSHLESIYEGFAYPSTLTYGGFEECRYLKYVPGSLFSRLTTTSALNAAYMFSGCISLATLGDGFSIPSQITNVSGMFKNCDSLTYIPASLNLVAFGEKGISSMFTDGADGDWSSVYPYDPLKPTYFAGTLAQLSQLLPSVKTNLPSGVTEIQVNTPETYWELVYGRKLVLTGNAVALHARQKGASEWPSSPWQSVYALDNRLADPGYPDGNSYGFSGWYDNPEMTGTPLAFPLSVNRAMNLYAEYLPTSGALPCAWTDAAGKAQTITAANVAAGKGDASRAGWSFDPGTGTLSVWSAIGTTVSNLWAGNANEWASKKDTVSTLYWGPLRSRIVAVDTTQLSGAVDMGCWFMACSHLADISAFRIPDSSRGGSIPVSLYNTLSSTAIRELPSTFYVPEGVQSLHATFAGSPLETVYEGFAFPSTLTYGGFEGCTALKYVPGALFSRLTASSALDAGYMFAQCFSLTTLGDGFSIPTQVTNVGMMFASCPSLAYIPSSLDLTGLGDKGASSMFGYWNPEDGWTTTPFSPLKKTYFAGTSAQLAKLLPSSKTNHLSVTASQIATAQNYWKLIYGRELVLLNPTTSDDNVVVFIEKKLDDGAIGWDVLPPQKKVDGKIDLPDTQNYYGYLLRWYADALRNTPVTIENGKLLVGDTNKVYGLLTPIISMDMPIPGGEGNQNKVDLIINRANNSVEVAGTQDGKAPIKIQSFTPVATKLSVSTRQTMDQLNLSDVLFGGRPTAVSLVIAIKDGETYKLRLSGSAFANIAQIAKATSDEDPGVVDGTLTLEIPAAMDIADWDDQVDSVELTTVTWTVAI